MQIHLYHEKYRAYLKTTKDPIEVSIDLRLSLDAKLLLRRIFGICGAINK
mgnify:CR=1 FL=1